MYGSELIKYSLETFLLENDMGRLPAIKKVNMLLKRAE